MTGEGELTPPKPRRHGRFLVVFALAIILVTLPVLPLRFLGLPGPDMREFTQVIGAGGNLFGIMKPRKVEDLPRAAMQTNKAKSENIKLLDGAARSLLLDIEKEPANPSLHNQVGLLYAELGDFETAERHFAQAISLSRKRIAELSEGSKQMKQQGNVKAAASLLVQSSKLSVDLSAAHGNLARVYESLGRHDKVVKQLEEMKRDIAFNADLSHIAAGHGQAAASETNAKARRISPAIIAELANAQALMQRQRLPEAMEAYRRVIAVDPNVALAHQQLGLIAGMTGNLYLAEEELREAARLDPTDASTRTNLGITYSSLGDTLKARREFERALEADPKSIHAALSLSGILSAGGEYAQAHDVLARAVKHNPRHPVLLNNLATMCSLEGNYPEAINTFHKSLSIAPNLASAHYGLGLALYNQKDYSRCIQEFKRALQLDPHLIDAHSKIESAYRKVGIAHSGRSG